MTRNITENDLILYFYSETTSEISSFITANLDKNPSWVVLLDSLKEVKALEFTNSFPSATTEHIILEESNIIEKISHS
jgi:hypothetical protein